MEASVTSVTTLGSVTLILILSTSVQGNGLNSTAAQEERFDGSDVISQILAAIGTSLGVNTLGPDGGKEVSDRRKGKGGRQQPVALPTCGGGQCNANGAPVECGQPIRSYRIVGGSPTIPGTYPWSVGIQFLDKLYCGGSLISREFVITAAHCVKGINQAKIRLTLGDHNRGTRSQQQQLKLIEKVFVHPHFVKKTFNNDIALIKMRGEVEFNDFIRPVCLPSTDRSYNGQDTIVVGWGKKSEGGLPAQLLQEVSVPIIPQKKCRHQTNYRTSEITENMFCAGFDNGKVDACQGDSGGPAVWKGEGENSYTQIGIVSWGQGCARGGYPGVYTRIGRYLEWIVNVIKENHACFCPRS